MEKSNNSQTSRSISDTVQRYLKHKAVDCSEETVKSHRYRLSNFIRWAEDEHDYGLDAISPLLLSEYRHWRKDDGDLNRTTLHTQMVTLRVFLRWCARKQLVDDRLPKAVDVPSLERDDNVRDSKLDYERAEAILEYLDTYEYASFEHVLLLLLTQTGMRIGAVRAIDLDDFDESGQRLDLVHRPDSGTPLKNKARGERVLALSVNMTSILSDYIEGPRHATVDDSGRHPLLTTKNGRPGTSWLRRVIYRLTQPCYIGDCPHDTTPRSCDAEGYASNDTSPAECPSTRPPHDIRRGVITHWRSEGDIPDRAIQGRTNVSEKVLDQHYDKRSEEQKAEQRRRFFEDL